MARQQELLQQNDVEVVGLTVGANPEEDWSWMAGFWNHRKGDHFARQDWGHENGSSVWPKEVQEHAKVCVIGLENMIAFFRHDRNPQESGPGPDAWMLQVAWNWCRRVEVGMMPHGALLAHARQTGAKIMMHPTQDFLVPRHRHGNWDSYDWELHGRHGVAAVRRMLTLHGFWPEPIRPVDQLVPVAPVRSRADDNDFTKSKCIPAAMWKEFSSVRGVELYVDDAFTKENYTWAHMEGRPQRDNWYQCPASSVRAPGECNVSWYMQAKGHYFWALYPSEYDGSLVAKWVRGRQPAGGVMWRADYAADISCGPASVNDFKFVTGITLDRSVNDFQIFLYMEREPRNGGVEKLHMLACKTVPKAVRMLLHPGAFQPRKNQAGWTQDPGRREMIWQERENGACTWAVEDMVFRQDHPGAHIFRRIGTVEQWDQRDPAWEDIGTLGTEGQVAEDPVNEKSMICYENL